MVKQKTTARKPVRFEEEQLDPDHFFERSIVIPASKYSTHITLKVFGDLEYQDIRTYYEVTQAFNKKQNDILKTQLDFPAPTIERKYINQDNPVVIEHEIVSVVNYEGKWASDDQKEAARQLTTPPKKAAKKKASEASPAPIKRKAPLKPIVASTVKKIKVVPRVHQTVAPTIQKKKAPSPKKVIIKQEGALPPTLGKGSRKDPVELSDSEPTTPTGKREASIAAKKRIKETVDRETSEEEEEPVTKKQKTLKKKPTIAAGITDSQEGSDDDAPLIPQKPHLKKKLSASKTTAKAGIILKSPTEAIKKKKATAKPVINKPLIKKKSIEEEVEEEIEQESIETEAEEEDPSEEIEETPTKIEEEFEETEEAKESAEIEESPGKTEEESEEEPQEEPVPETENAEKETLEDTVVEEEEEELSEEDKEDEEYEF